MAECLHSVVVMYPTTGRYAPPKQYWSCQECGANFEPSPITPPTTDVVLVDREQVAQIAELMAAGETYGTGRQKAINIAAVIRALPPYTKEYVDG